MRRRLSGELAALRRGMSFVTAFEYVGAALLLVHIAFMVVFVVTGAEGWRFAASVTLPIAVVVFWAAAVEARNAERIEHAAAEKRAYLRGVYEERMGWTR